MCDNCFYCSLGFQLTPDNSRFCSGCHLVKPFDMFTKTSDGHLTRCKKCISNYYAQPKQIEYRANKYDKKKYEEYLNTIQTKFPDKYDEVLKHFTDYPDENSRDKIKYLRQTINKLLKQWVKK